MATFNFKTHYRSLVLDLRALEAKLDFAFNGKIPASARVALDKAYSIYETQWDNAIDAREEYTAELREFNCHAIEDFNKHQLHILDNALRYRHNWIANALRDQLQFKMSKA